MYPPSLANAAWRKSSYSSHNGACVEVAWRKSSYSGANGSCVEVAFTDPQVGIRDSKNTATGHLTLPPATWTTFLAAVRGDDLNR